MLVWIAFCLGWMVMLLGLILFDRWSSRGIRIISRRRSLFLYALGSIALFLVLGSLVIEIILIAL